MRIALSVFVMLCFAAAAAGAPIYKWVDEHGVMQYSSQKPADKQALQLQVPSSPVAVPASGIDAAPASGVVTRRNSLDEIDAELKRRREKQAAEEAQAEKESMARQKKCDMAKSKLGRLLEQGPVFTLNNQGEKVYLDDTTRDAEIAAYKKDVTGYCDK